MRLIFWLNSLSIHQLPYISKLNDDDRVDEVIVVAGCDINDARKKMGWNMYNVDTEKYQTYIAPSDDVIEQLLSDKSSESVHLFSGIRGFAFVYNAFKLSLKYNVKRGIITERPDTYAFGLANGKPLWLHKLRFCIQDRKYIPYIDYIFTIGEQCYDYYNSLSKKWRLFPFAYCTAKTKAEIQSVNKQEFSLLYVGSLSWWKSVKTILKVMNSNVRLTIVGDGDERMDLEKIVRKRSLNNVCFLGIRPNNEITNIMATNDVLVLPSIYDGWGAVVNEALMTGMYVVCSDKCGAKDALQEQWRGLVFQGGNEKELAKCLEYIDEHIVEIRENRIRRKEWAEMHIGGDAIAKYMVDCLSNIDTNVPWRN